MPAPARFSRPGRCGFPRRADANLDAFADPVGAAGAFRAAGRGFEAGRVVFDAMHQN